MRQRFVCPASSRAGHVMVIDKSTSLKRLARAWLSRAESGPAPIVPENLSAAARARLEKQAQGWIGQLVDDQMPLVDQAAAFRSLIELVGASAREAETFFGVQPEVVILAISLQPLPASENLKRPRRKPAGQSLPTPHSSLWVGASDPALEGTR